RRRLIGWVHRTPAGGKKIKMNYNAIIIRYGEISLKGKNRRMFENKLKTDIKNFLKNQNIDFTEVSLKMGRIYIKGIHTLPPLEKIFGIHSYSPALEIEKDYALLEKKTVEFFPLFKDKESFRVTCQRIDKTFPRTSVDVERSIGEIIFENTETAVNLTNPEINFQVEIGEDSIYIFTEKIKGFSGLPFGSAGKLVSLISAGIDSPVATFLMMKRGVEPILLHFRITESDAAKVKKLQEKLEEYSSGREIKLYEIERDEIFKGQFDRLYNNRKFHPYICILCKYLMHKKAAEIAAKEKAYGLITGDNLAQVASQTLKNLYAYHTVSGLPVYSPLISFEKQETMRIAREIGTYDISISKSYGCTPPKNPKTGVKIENFQKILAAAGFDEPHLRGGALKLSPLGE
ncbi:MAG: tRNA 4-thiouridine(8) synthase ThiI, partial [Candidatus Aminicenantes bacterium]|nr:tRNA 4-thiouridine(8) synthase ThiI [Candidatus Aminicenantes bacterium]